MTASRVGFRRLSGNDARMSVASEIIAWAAKRDRPTAVVFPAGYLRAKNRTDAIGLIKKLRRTEGADSLSVAVGVDLCSNSECPKGKTSLAKGASGKRRLPFLAGAWSVGEADLHVWRQRSSTGAGDPKSDAYLVSNRECLQERFITVGKDRIAVLICGECFNPRIVSRIREWNSKPTVGVVLGHCAYQSMIHKGLQRVAKEGFPALLSIHTKQGNGKFQAWRPSGSSGLTENVGLDAVSKIFMGPPRVQVRSWSVKHGLTEGKWAEVQGEDVAVD